MAVSPEAQANFEALASNDYTGRGIVMGRAVTGDLAQVYWVTGRSEPSRNRVILVEDGVARTDVFDESKVEPDQLEYLIYNAMASAPGHHVVSNGKQTDDIVRGLRFGESFDEVLNDWPHEFDSVRTPRISGVLHENGPVRYQFSVISIHPEQELLEDPRQERSLRQKYAGTMHNSLGEALGIHTYLHDAPQGEMVPSFRESPYALPLGEDIDETLAMYWNALDNPANDSNRVSVVVKTINPDTGRIDFRHQNQLG